MRFALYFDPLKQIQLQNEVRSEIKSFQNLPRHEFDGSKIKFRNSL